jgi:hypothetical protein
MKITIEISSIDEFKSLFPQFPEERKNCQEKNKPVVNTPIKTKKKLSHSEVKRRNREIVRLRDLGLSYKEICKKVDCNYSTVNIVLFRHKKNIKSWRDEDMAEKEEESGHLIKVPPGELENGRAHCSNPDCFPQEATFLIGQMIKYKNRLYCTNECLEHFKKEVEHFRRDV